MTHRIYSVSESDPARFDSTGPWVALLLLVLLLAVIIAFMAPLPVNAPDAFVPRGPTAATAENPELGAFGLYTAAQHYALREALLDQNPELSSVARYQIAQATEGVAQQDQNPELAAFWRYNR